MNKKLPLRTLILSLSKAPTDIVSRVTCINPQAAIALFQKKPVDCPFEKIFPSQLNRDDEFFMSLAYNQALEAYRADEVPVGAIVVMEGEIVASAHNEVESTGDPTAHAEILAVTQASRFIGDPRLNAMTLYVTKEPCPMCSGAMIMSRMGRVVFGVRDPKMGFLGSAWDVRDVKTLNHYPLVTAGVMEEECHALLRTFFEEKRKNKDRDG